MSQWLPADAWLPVSKRPAETPLIPVKSRSLAWCRSGLRPPPMCMTSRRRKSSMTVIFPRLMRPLAHPVLGGRFLPWTWMCLSAPRGLLALVAGRLALAFQAFVTEHQLLVLPALLLPVDLHLRLLLLLGTPRSPVVLRLQGVPHLLVVPHPFAMWCLVEQSSLRVRSGQSLRSLRRPKSAVAARLLNLVA